MIKFTNTTKTAAQFNGAAFSLAAPEDWQSIGDGPTREAVLAWLADSNTPLPADIPPIYIPTTVTMAQAQLALLAAGHLDAVEAAVAQMPREAQILWRKANTVVRGDPLMVQLAALLGLTDAQIDALFIAAGKL